jgi:cold shock protein
MLGVCKWYDTKRGYGFITPISPELTSEIFVHATSIITAHKLPKLLMPGDEVEFEVEEVERGIRARRVTVLKRVAQQPNYVQRRD